ncbi:MAG TPA: ATP-binding protein, partial [Chitinophagales bacterium]|nr:ATP-binding protein [Chitinophagales bacterium]
QGKIFHLRLVFFENKGFEIILNDITLQEKTRVLKQEMTGNIAHELRTPVTGIRGYLETILTQKLELDKQLYFTEKAFLQTKVLSELIQDMSLIAKIEEAGYTFTMQAIHLKPFLEQIKEDYTLQFTEKRVQFTINIPEECTIKGNQNLLHSVFRNLIDNALRYAGNDTNITIYLYNQDADFCYFSFYDTGKGIEDEKHLSRIFERFYRVNEGRTRDMGGSGLGLSIVKNAIQIHGGTIYAKNRKEGGLEFLFHLKRA